MPPRFARFCPGPGGHRRPRKVVSQRSWRHDVEVGSNGTTSTTAMPAGELRRVRAPQMRLVASAGSTVGEVHFPGVDLTPAPSLSGRGGPRGRRVPRNWTARSCSSAETQCHLHVFRSDRIPRGRRRIGLNVVVRRRRSTGVRCPSRCENACRPRRRRGHRLAGAPGATRPHPWTPAPKFLWRAGALPEDGVRGQRLVGMPVALVPRARPASCSRVTGRAAGLPGNRRDFP